MCIRDRYSVATELLVINRGEGSKVLEKEVNPDIVPFNSIKYANNFLIKYDLLNLSGDEFYKSFGSTMRLYYVWGLGDYSDFEYDLKLCENKKYDFDQMVQYCAGAAFSYALKEGFKASYEQLGYLEKEVISKVYLSNDGLLSMYILIGQEKVLLQDMPEDASQKELEEGCTYNMKGLLGLGLDYYYQDVLKYHREFFSKKASLLSCENKRGQSQLN